MAIGLPVKANYAAGDILTATNMNDLSGTFNNVATSYGNAAGKNKIINGDFSINQRNFTSVTATGYCFDRWYAIIVGASQTYTPQVFTPGTAPVAGYEGTNFLRMVTVAGASNLATINQRIEDVRTFAGQTITVSFWVKAATGTPKMGLLVNQSFGSGGSSTVNVSDTTVNITTSWARYSITVAIPSISGKTIGAGSYLEMQFQGNNAFWAIGQQSNTFDFWGVQVEAGSIATPFQTASGGSIQNELAMCQRYYVRFGGQSSYQVLANGYAAIGGTKVYGIISLPVPMRVIPLSLDFSNLAFQDSNDAISSNFSAVTLAAPGLQTVRFDGTTSGQTAGRPGVILTNNSTSAFLGFSAEL